MSNYKNFTTEQKMEFFENGKQRPLSREERKVVRAFLRRAGKVNNDEEKMFIVLDNGEYLKGWKAGFIKKHIEKYGFEGACYNMYGALSAFLVEKDKDRVVTNFEVTMDLSSLDIMFDIVNNIILPRI